MQVKASNPHTDRFDRTLSNLCVFAGTIERDKNILDWVERTTAKRPNAEYVLAAKYRGKQYYIGAIGSQQFIANYTEDWIVVEGGSTPIYFNTTAVKFEEIDQYK